LAVLSRFDGMPSFERKNKNRACDDLLESPVNFPSTKKVSKIQLQIRIVVPCPKSQNSIYETYNPLGVKLMEISTTTLTPKDSWVF
jgi:hypothetical protein